MISYLKYISSHLFNTNISKVLLFLVLTSCMSDNMDNCPFETTLRFEYTLNDNYTDLFKDQITHLDLLVYDENGNFIKTYELLQNELINGNTFLLDLPSGKYTLVAWANITGALYQMNYTPRIEDMCVKLNIRPSTEANPVQGSLFHGITSTTIDTNADSYHTISLTKNTQILHVLLEETGTNTPLQLGDYSVQISGCNGTYNYENKTAGSDLLNYMPRYSVTGVHTMKVNYTLLRLLTGDDLNIKITASDGTVIYNEALTSKILQSPNYNSDEDLDRSDEYILMYKIDKAPGVGWTVNLISINDWNITNQGGGLN